MMMFTDIRKKKLIFENRRPYGMDKENHIKELNFLDLVYCNLRLSGSEISKEGIYRICLGEVDPFGTIEDHMKIRRYIYIFENFFGRFNVHQDIDERLMSRLYSAIADSDAIYRRDDAPVRHLNYRPLNFREIPIAMKMVPRWETLALNELQNAVKLHNIIIKIYPFSKHTEELARNCLLYYMVSKGYPIFDFELQVGEYNELIAKWLADEDNDELYRKLEVALILKLQLLLGVTS